MMRFRAWRGLSDAYRAAAEGHSPWSADAREASPIDVPDARASEDLAGFRELFARERIGSLSFFPLRMDHRVIGKLAVYRDTPRRIDEGEADLAMSIANKIAIAVTRFQAAAERERLIHELEAALRFQETFTGILGHDLRNPLAAILTGAQLAAKRNTSANVAGPLGRIVSSAERMARMIDQLLDFTRLRLGGGIPLQRAPVDLAQVVHAVLEEVRLAYPGVSIAVEHGGDARGHWDADRLSQVFANLVVNAVRHGRRDHGVHVRLDGSDAEQVVVAVHNAGSIAPDVAGSLFEAMALGDRSRAEGLGLGLYITREIVVAHGGDVGVESDDARGTTFTVTLPREVMAP